MSTGLESYVGFAEESTWGTFEAATAFVPCRVANGALDREILKSEAIVNGNYVQDVTLTAAGNKTAAVEISMPLWRTDAAIVRLLLEHMFGTESGGNGSVATPFLYSPASHKGKGLSITIAKPRTDGTITPVGYEGCKITNWSIGIQPGQISTLDLSFVAETAAVVSAPTVSQTLVAPYTGAHAALTIAAGTRSVESLTISGENGLDTSRRFIGSDEIAEPLTTADRIFMVEPTVEFADATDLTTYFAAPAAQALVATLTAGNDVLRFTANGLMMEGGDPQVPGKQRLVQPLKYEAFTTAAGAQSTAILAELWDAGVPT